MSTSDNSRTSPNQFGRDLHVAGSPGRGGRLGALLRRCGLTAERQDRRRQAADRFGAMDQLEGRVLLGGDHPSLDLPLTPASGTLITLDGGTGEGNDTGTIGTNGDQDLFRFTAVGDDFIRVWADTVNANGSTLNSRVEVYTIDGPPPIASGSTNGKLTAGTFKDGWAGFVGQAGTTYYVAVMSDVLNGDVGSTGDYILRIDGKSEGAITPDPDTGEGTAGGNITLTGSDQVLVVTAGGTGAFDSLATFNANADAAQFDSRLDVYDSTGKALVGNSETGHLSNAFCVTKSTPGQVFYVRVRSDEFDPADQLSKGQYLLKIDFSATPVPLDPVLRQGSDQNGALASTADSALYSFKAEGTGRGIITVVGLPIPPLADPALRLYDSNGTAIAFNKLYGAAEIQTALTGGQTYFVVVEAFDDPLPAGGLFGIWVEANHTYNSDIPVDDHANVPDFGNATPLVWGPASLLLDADGNPVGDRSYVTNAVGSGRIQGATDTDLFQFVPPMDMLSGYAGDDGNEDLALYVGGSGTFTLNGTVDPNYSPFQQDFMAILDAPGRQQGTQKWWNAAGGLNGIVRALVAFDPDGAQGPLPPMMIAGGEFTFAGGPLNGVPASRIAAYAYDPLQGRYVWSALGSGVNGTVHALAVYDDDGDQGPNPVSVFVGGEFTNKGNHIAKWSPAGGWSAVAGGVNNNVYALTVMDPPDVGVFADPVLVAGGAFTDKGNHIAVLSGGAWSNVLGGGVNGIVRALTSFDDPGQDGNGDEIPNKIIAGGEFTDKGNHIASLTWVDDGNGNALAQWAALGTGVNDIVYALTVWDRDGEQADDFGPVVVAGGAFTDKGQHIAQWNGAGWSGFGLGMNGTVRSLAVITDFEYNPFDIDLQGNVHNEPRLFAGGDFTTADGDPAAHIAKWEIDQATGLTAWLARPSGSTGPIYALAGMNDEIPGLWDRADRTAARLQIILGGTTESFLNTFLTVYDSNFNVIYTNDTIAPPFPDPSGMIDPSTAGAGLANFIGIPVWGGEVYYIAVSGVTGTGRYSFTVRTDAVPPDTNGDGVDDDTTSIYSELPDAGQWDAAQSQAELFINGSDGDGRNFIANPLAAFNGRLWDPTPSGYLLVQAQELAMIETVDDTDLYMFRAPVSGTVEVRIATTGIQDQNYERIINLVSGAVEVTDPALHTLNSPLDSTLTVFGDDLQEITSDDTNAAIQGATQTTYVGSFNRTFNRRDARVVFNVTAGDVYFLQVGSGQAATFAQDPTAVDWRHATGGYEILVNAEPDLNYDDDHANTGGGPEAMIPMDETAGSPTNGSGFLGGEIANVPGNLSDQDSFGFISPGAGVVTLTVNADENSAVIPSVQVIDAANQQVIAQGTAGGDGKLTLHFPSAKGDRFVIDVTGSGGSQGAYTVTVAGVPFVDGNPDDSQWLNATELTILDFLGSATAFGTIDGAGDTDLFKFTTPGYDVATVAVQKVGGSLDTFVTVYEVTEDAVGNTLRLRIAYNDNANGSTDSRVSFPITAPDRTSTLTGNTYNSYYILVSGNDGETQSGDYQVTLTLTPTDDHPDAGQFDFASSIIVDSATGLGSDVGNLEESGDTDLFQFTAPAGGPVTIDIAAIVGSTVRPLVRIFDVNQQPVLDINTGLDSDTGDDTAPSSATFSFNVVRNQVYYILVEGVAGGANTTDTGQYTVAITGPTVDDHANITEFDLATRINLSVQTGDGLSTGVIGTLNDTDIFYFTTYKDGTHGITVSTPGSGLTPRIRLYAGDQSLLVDITDGSGQDEDGATDGSVTYTVNAGAAGEVYYVLVSAGAGGDDTGDYSVAIDGQAPDEPPPDGSDDHPDAGEFDIATPILLSSLTGDGSALGVIEDAGDTDLFVFSSLAGGKAFVQVVTPEGTLLDVGVKIYGPDHTLLVSDTEGVPGANANADFTTGAANELYYIEVDGLGSGVGSYTVKVNTQPEVNYLYFPEGFANANIHEYVSIANPNADAATYTVTLYYEDANLAPVVLQSNIILAAGSRGGLTLSAGGANGLLPGIIADTPYSLVVTSNKPLGANFSHYDFGQALGEAFTERTSSSWTFARAERLSGFVNDFVTFYNPNDNAVTVTLTAYTDAGIVTLIKTVGAKRRGGWNLDAEGSLPQGAFGIVLTSAPANGGDPHIGIVAALSHYSTANHQGDLSLGDGDGGTSAGIIPTLTYSPSITPQITFFNPSNSQISVTIRGTYINAALPTLNRILTIQARDSFTLEGAEIGLISAQPIGLRYTSTGDVTVLARQAQMGDSDATQSGTQAASGWFFGDAFINAASAGVTYFETLNFYNPDAASALPITVSFFFNDGTSGTTTVNVGEDGFAALKLHELPLILNRGGLNFFSIQVTAARPFVTSMTHYDLFLGGGWTSSGAPLGLLNPIDTIV